MQGIECLGDAEVEGVIGADRESHQRDLYEAIENGDFPKWRFCVQDHAGAGRGRRRPTTPSTSPRSGRMATIR